MKRDTKTRKKHRGKEGRRRIRRWRHVSDEENKKNGDRKNKGRKQEEEV